MAAQGAGHRVMDADPSKHRRRSLRLKGYDYKQAGAYFVTVCTRNRECLLGEVMAGEMQLNLVGHAVEESWEWLTKQYRYVQLDEWVVMPNHLHGIVIISDDASGGSRTAPMKIKPLGRLIGAFKTVSTKRVNEMRGTCCFALWQRDYYEHLIRNESDLARVRQYINDNPRSWLTDPENPAAKIRKIQLSR